MQHWTESIMFQTGSYLALSLDYNKLNGYKGLVWGLGLSMVCYGAIVPVIKGTMVVGPDGKLDTSRSDPAVRDQKIYDVMLGQVQMLRGCEAVDHLQPGGYLVGTFYYSRVSHTRTHLSHKCEIRSV
jgi:hypothetical protein